MQAPHVTKGKLWILSWRSTDQDHKVWREETCYQVTWRLLLLTISKMHIEPRHWPSSIYTHLFNLVPTCCVQPILHVQKAFVLFPGPTRPRYHIACFQPSQSQCGRTIVWPPDVLSLSDPQRHWITNVTCMHMQQSRAIRTRQKFNSRKKLQGFVLSLLPSYIYICIIRYHSKFDTLPWKTLPCWSISDVKYLSLRNIFYEILIICNKG